MNKFEPNGAPSIVLDTDKLLLLGGLPKSGNNVMMGPKPSVKPTKS